MQRQLALAIAAVIGAGAATSFAQANRDTDARGEIDTRRQGVSIETRDNDGTAAPNGTAAAPDAEGIRDTLASATEAFVKEGTFDDLVERFVDADRNRIGQTELSDQEMEQINAAARGLLNAWEGKYREEFDIEDEQAVFSGYNIQQSEIGKAAARTAGDRDVDADIDTRREGDRADVNVDTDVDTGVDNPASVAADANRNDPGRNIATVTVPASRGMPQLQVPMIHEFPDAWKIDVPDTVDGPKLRQNILAHLESLKNTKEWPANDQQAYQLVARHMLMAVMDKPVQQQQQQ